MITRISILTLLLYSAFMFSQPNINLTETKEDLLSDIIETRIHANMNLCHYYVYYNLDSAEYFIQKAMQLDSIHDSLHDSIYRPYMLRAWVHQGKYQ